MKDGAFEGLIENLDFADNWTVAPTSGVGAKKNPAPLPTEVPERIDLSQVPQNILKSNVVETLVSQNEDLMSRLSVALRRNAVLEEKLSDARLETEQIRAKYENLNDQLLVLKEKSKALAQRKEREESEYTALREQIKLLEIRYAELYSTSQTKEANLLKSFEEQSKANRRLMKYRARVRAAVESLKKSAREKWQAEVNLAKSEATQESLRRHLAESADYIAQMSKEHKQAIAALTEENEKRLAQLREQLAEALSRNEKLGERVHDYDQLVQEKMRLENEIILRDRREEELRIQTTAEITDLQKALARHRNETKELTLQLEKTQTELQETAAAYVEAKSTQKALEEQVENLQILWRDNQSQIEKLNAKNASLQKLNQELSIAINQYRREIREYKEAVDRQALQALDRTAKTDPGLEAIASGTASATSVVAEAEKSVTAHMNAQNSQAPELLQKIDEVFVDLHSSSKL